MQTQFRSYLQKQYYLPSEHGSWVFIFSPLLIGFFAGRNVSAVSIYLVIAALSAFLIRQPITMATKALSGRRPKRDLLPSVIWAILYGTAGMIALSGLILKGFAHLLILALPGVPVFLWHLWLISRRAERRQIGIEVVGSGVLSLAAPAAYWVSTGRADPVGWWLFILCWLQSAASIVYAYLRLHQREWDSVPPWQDRMRFAQRPLLYTFFNFAFVLLGSRLSFFSWFLWIPFLLQLIETLWGSLVPAIDVRPTRIGIRQLIVSSLFTFLFIITW